MWWNILVTLLIISRMVKSQRDCSQHEYDRCIRIADPLVKEAHLVFPDNMNDIALVCRTWNTFVDCLKEYTDKCFTDQQRRQFNRAVESPIESIHQMCMQKSYQEEYLQYAPCIKSTVIEKNHCGPHYNLLVDQVEQGDIISKSTLCCSHDRFKQCVLRETRRLCDRGISDGPANRFASHIIEKALRFLQDQCINYIPNSDDCTSPHDSIISYSDRSEPSSAISTASSDVYPWSTIRQEFGAKEISSRLPKISTASWSPSSIPPREGDNSVGPGSVFPTQHLGTRTRPASYGRSNSWASDPSPSSSIPTSTTPMFPGFSSTQTNIREKFGTAAASWDVYAGHNKRLEGNGISASPSFRPSDYSPSTTPSYDSPRSPLWNPSNFPSTETWYPAAGNQLTNEVDEPNQLGLKKPKNAAIELRTGIMNEFIVVLLAMFSILRTLIS